MHPMPQANAMNLKSHKSVLLGTSALVCLALAAPVMADDFVITSSDGSTNGVGTQNGAEGDIADNAIDGSDTVSLGIALTTTGANEGIETTGGTNKVTVSETGSITTGGNAAYGIRHSGDDNVTTVSGSIETTGFDGYGIRHSGDDNVTTVSGSIEAAGTFTFGIRNYGDDNVTTISGTVKATGASSAALYSAGGDGNSFTLNEGATIIGDILARDATNNAFDATNSKLIFNLGASTSYAYSVSGKGEGTTAGQWTFSDLDGPTQGITTTGTGCDTTIPDAGNTVCNLVTGVSTGNLEAQDELQFSMNTSMIGSLSLGSSNSAAPVEAMSFAQTPQNNAWFNIYGDTSDRSASTTKLAFDGSNRGLTIGTPVAISDTLNLDLVFNASNANLDIGSAKEQQITAKSYDVGAVLRDLAPSTGWAVDAFGFVGRNSYDGKRKVMNNQEATGSETVTASYSGTEVLVGVNAQRSKPINETVSIITGVNASLSNEKIGAYSESKYYSWDARRMTQVSGGLNLGLEYRKNGLTTFANLGAQGSSLSSGKTANYTNNGTAGSYTDNSKNGLYRTVSVGFDYAGKDGMSFTGTVEAFSSTGGVSGNSASLGVNWKF